VIKKRYLGIIGLMLVMNGCGAIDSNYQLLQTNQTVKKSEETIQNKSIEYRILPQDRLKVILYKDPSQESLAGGSLGQSMVGESGILVNASGMITLPLIGKVKVAGLTQTGAADRITRRYKKYLNTPSVYLEVLNKRIFVLGEVKHPGVVKLDKEKMTIFEAIAFAGDLTDSAVRDNIIILSNNGTKGLQMRKVDLTHFDQMHYASLMLRPNDIVYVQPDSWKEFKVSSSNFTAPFETISKLAAPFITLKYLDD
jgi:polysaccharide export outer membrane protein